MPAGPALQSDDLNPLLKAVSRSFYLSLRLLPKPVRPTISLAYLLARATDTIADTRLLPLQSRLNALALLRDRILGASLLPIQFNEVAEAQPASPASKAEQTLLLRIEEPLQLAARLAPSDLAHLRRVLGIIVSGQELDLRRFESQPHPPILALQSIDELMDYTYRVAGCVGEFWTACCADHLFDLEPRQVETLTRLGIQFGQGLQLVNILRDLPSDLSQGRCYLPADRLRSLSLTPDDLIEPGHWPKLEPLYRELLVTADRLLRAGWQYTCLLPFTPARLRIACAIPILIGLKTLSLLAASNPLDARQRIKISRKSVRSVLLQTIVLYPFQNRWQKLATSIPQISPAHAAHLPPNC